MISCKLKNQTTVELDMNGDVTANDYRTVEPQLLKYFSDKGRMKFLIVLKGLKTFSLGAAYEDIKFDLQNLKNVGTTAIVGDKKTQELLSKFIDKVFPAKVKYFEETSDAMNWLKDNPA